MFLNFVLKILNQIFVLKLLFQKLRNFLTLGVQGLIPREACEMSMYNNSGRYRRSIYVVNSCSSVESNDEEDADSSADYGSSTSESAAVLPPPSTLVITRRQKNFGITTTPPLPEKQNIPQKFSPRDITVVKKTCVHVKSKRKTCVHVPIFQVQDLWIELATKAGKLFPKCMWAMLNAVKSESKVTQDKVLQAVRPILSAQMRREWPKTRNQLDKKIRKHVGSLYPRVTLVVDIDLSALNLPGLTKPVRFPFLDPIFAWVRCADKLSRQHKLHFKYQELRHPDTGEHLYGASVANGLIMKRACEKLTVSAGPTAPALIGLSWDSGNATKRRSYTPILISVGNSNFSGAGTCVCIGYLPKLNLAKKVAGSPAGLQAQHKLVQACAKAIIQCIERCAGGGGFTCTLHSNTGERVKWHLQPVLARMEFDTKERTKFFGLTRQRACGIGSGPRKGRSLFRACTPHSTREGTPRPDSRMRHGLNPQRPVTALKRCKHSVLQWPGRIYHGLFAYDVLHVLYINAIRYFQEAVLDLLTPAKQKILDDRVRAFTPFRDPVTGRTTPKVTSLTRIGYLSGEQRVQHLFAWAHAVGSQAKIFLPELREHVVRCMCSLQVMCFTVRGKRAFTEREHRCVQDMPPRGFPRHPSTISPHDMHPRHAPTTCGNGFTCLHDCHPRHPFTISPHDMHPRHPLRYVFQHHGKCFYRALSKLTKYRRKERVISAQCYNVGKPPQKRRRVPYIQPTVVDSGATSETASSSAEEICTFFEHSSKIVPHAIMHFADQVIMGGTHDFHDTKENEASHKECVKTAGERARIYTDVNLSAYNMLQFNMQREWFDSIFDIRLGVTNESETDGSEAESLEQIRLSNCISDPTSTIELLASTRKGLRPNQIQHNMLIFDHLLCEGVPISVRELLCLFAERVRYPVEDSHLLLQCSWTLGYHVKSVTSKGVTRNYWGGGLRLIQHRTTCVETG